MPSTRALLVAITFAGTAWGGTASPGTVSVEADAKPLSLQFTAGSYSACDDAASICVTNGRAEAVEVSALDVELALIGDDLGTGIPGNVFEVTPSADESMTIAAGTAACVPVKVCTSWAAWESRDPNGDGLKLKDNAETTALRIDVRVEGGAVLSDVVTFEGEVASAAP